MKRIVILGCYGAGKSTFAKKLSMIVNIPLYHIDLFRYDSDGNMVPKEELSKKVDNIINEDTWIIDGNFEKELEKRLVKCDTIFLLDIPIKDCIEGIKSRIGKKRSDIPFIEKEFTDKLRNRVIEFPAKKMPLIRNLMSKYENDKSIVIFNSRKGIDDYLKNIKA